MEEESPERENKQSGRYAVNVVMISGIFGIVAAAIMYFDAVSRGEVYLHDSLWIIIGALILGVITFIVGVYVYIKSNKTTNAK